MLVLDLKSMREEERGDEKGRTTRNWRHFIELRISPSNIHIQHVWIIQCSLKPTLLNKAEGGGIKGNSTFSGPLAGLGLLKGGTCPLSELVKDTDPHSPFSSPRTASYRLPHCLFKSRGNVNKDNDVKVNTTCW